MVSIKYQSKICWYEVCIYSHQFLFRVHFFVDGHNMAARVSKSITAASVQLKKHLHDYNNIPGAQLLTWKDVTNVSSPLWLFDNFNSTSQHIPKSIKLR